MNSVTKQALEKGARAERLTPEEALALSDLKTPEEIHLLGTAARNNRIHRFAKVATYVTNLSINPSNICEGNCAFCGYSARKSDDHAYVLDEQTILGRIDRLNPVEVHIVGGMNQEWGFNRNLELIRTIKRQRPQMHVKGFTAVEIDWFARSEKTTPTLVLEAFKEAGLNALPGGGAELFSERMRSRYCPTKLSPEGWLHIHSLAHGMGISTNATMLYGLDESPEERVEHLLALRAAQDQTGGYSCFIPLAYQPWKETDKPGPSVNTTLGVIALSRLVLDNVSHIKAYWPMIGLETTAAALSWGADDLDGTLGEERIAHAAGATTPKSTTRKVMEETIRLGGFTPVERDGWFTPVGTDPRNDED